MNPMVVANLFQKLGASGEKSWVRVITIVEYFLNIKCTYCSLANNGSCGSKIRRKRLHEASKKKTLQLNILAAKLTTILLSIRNAFGKGNFVTNIS